MTALGLLTNSSKVFESLISCSDGSLTELTYRDPLCDAELCNSVCWCSTGTWLADAARGTAIEQSQLKQIVKWNKLSSSRTARTYLNNITWDICFFLYHIRHWLCEVHWKKLLIKYDCILSSIQNQFSTALTVASWLFRTLAAPILVAQSSL